MFFGASPGRARRFSLTGERESLSGTVGLRLAAAQDRPGEFEEPTDGYAVLDLSGSTSLIGAIACTPRLWKTPQTRSMAGT